MKKMGKFRIIKTVSLLFVSLVLLQRNVYSSDKQKAREYFLIASYEILNHYNDKRNYGSSRKWVGEKWHFIDIKMAIKTELQK